MTLRGGIQETLAARELVPGDSVLLQAGDKAPTDLRLVAGRELRLDESVLTGESVPVDKSAEVLPPATVLVKRANMVYNSTLVIHGQGRGVVVATGAATEIGRISRLMSEVQELQTPLTRKMARFSQLLLWAVLGQAPATFGVGLWRGQPAVETFMAAVAKAGRLVGPAPSIPPAGRHSLPVREPVHGHYARSEGWPAPRHLPEGRGVEKVLVRCAQALDGQGRQAELDTAATLARARGHGSPGGLMVLALARGELRPTDPSLEYGEVECCFILLGLVGMIDPPRPEAVAAVAACREAGVRVKMITSDHALAIGAAAIRQLTGQEVTALAGAGLEEAVLATAVFARMILEEKLRLVQILQARGEIVAMTGDGVNDAPALK